MTTTPPTTFLAAQEVIAEQMPGYRRRPQQEMLAEAIESIFDGGVTEHLLAQAGTGTGKSLAAVIPLILASQRKGRNRRFVVATSTIALMNQYLRKDLPFLEQVFAEAGVKFSWAPLKGISNFLCLAKLAEQPQVEHLDELLEEIAPDDNGDYTHTGDRDDIATALDPRTEWPLVASTSDECPGKQKCPLAAKCFGIRHKDEARDAQIVVTNTAILMTDLKLFKQIRETSEHGVGKHVILDDYDGLIVDEAHELEATATNHLGFDIKQGGLIRFLEQAVSYLNLQGGDEVGAQDLQDVILSKFDSLGVLIAQKLGDEEKVAIDTQFIIDHFALFENLLVELDRMVTKLLRTKAKRGDTQKQTTTQQRLVATGQNFLANFKEVIGADPNAVVRWAELYGRTKTPTVAAQQFPTADMLRGHAATDVNVRYTIADLAIRASLTCKAALPAVNQLAADYVAAVQRKVEQYETTPSRAIPPTTGSARWMIKTAPIEVGPYLREELWSQVPAVLMSATLSAGTGAKRFSYIERSLGLQNAKTLDVGSPFDYAKQALLYVPDSSVPAPAGESRSAWATWAPEATMQLIKASGGGAMLLYTSRRDMDEAYRTIGHRLEAQGITCYVQGKDRTNREIAEGFRDNENSVLFGLRTFMTGMDFPGRTCRLVIINKLPFAVPTDPINEARSNACTARGGMPFYDLTVPEMTLVLEQAFGRLIRSATDWGVVAILDSRLSSKAYGKGIVRALPGAGTTTSLEDVRTFYTAWEASPAMKATA
ncbi:ATP-dependent DNA helicase [Streptomyces sp. NPDC059761]|uniref:ATP-dependent DNA helicase n=1 Tax=Streptomyces sp. NPDC059761 TaxID=3346937 RepID=UPI0036513400